MRPGELTHLLLPDDVDLISGLLRVRNRPRLGWQVKTRNEREIPLVPALLEVLRKEIGSRTRGPVFRRRKFLQDIEPRLSNHTEAMLEADLSTRIANREDELKGPVDRIERLRLARTIWRDCGAIKPDRIRQEFMRITRAAGFEKFTEPKMLRHMFATALQDANVDPLIRNEVMGHAPSGGSRGGFGLGMTAVYTHTRPETRRRQLESTFLDTPAIQISSRR